MTSNVSDTSTSGQRMRLMDALRAGPVTTIEAMRDLNILQPAARVSELRDMGEPIWTVREQLLDAHGRKHPGIARYVLLTGAETGANGLPAPEVALACRRKSKGIAKEETKH